MSARQEFEMSQADFDDLMAKINAARSAPLIMLQCGMPESPQEAANKGWESLGEKMGFDHMTVEPIVGKSALAFSAIVKATGGQ